MKINDYEIIRAYKNFLIASLDVDLNEKVKMNFYISFAWTVKKSIPRRWKWSFNKFASRFSVGLMIEFIRNL